MSKVLEFPTQFAKMRPGQKKPTENNMTYHVDFVKKCVTSIDINKPDGEVLKLDRRNTYLQRLNKKVG